MEGQVKTSTKLSLHFPMDTTLFPVHSLIVNFHGMRGNKTTKCEFSWPTISFCMANSAWVKSFCLEKLSAETQLKLQRICSARHQSINQSCKSQKTNEKWIPRTHYRLMRFCGASVCCLCEAHWIKIKIFLCGLQLSQIRISWLNES